MANRPDWVHAPLNERLAAAPDTARFTREAARLMNKQHLDAIKWWALSGRSGMTN
jgi:hypothetical protein